MIRNARTSFPQALARVLLTAGALTGAVLPATAQNAPAERRPQAGAKTQKPAQAAKPQQQAAKPQQASAEPAGAGRPTLVASVGDWGVYVTSGRDKQCYALAQPKDRAPGGLKRDAAYLFIATRPAEKVRNEVSIIMGFDVKAADKNAPEATIGSDKYALAAQGAHLWVRDANKTSAIVDAMRKAPRLTVKAASARGNVTTDSYSLAGLGGALDRVQKECP